MFKTLNNDIPKINNKYHKTDEEFNSFMRMAYHGYDYDENTGMDDGEILNGLEKLAKDVSGEEHSVQKAKAFAYIIDNTRIDVNESDYFVGFYSWNRLLFKPFVDKWHSEVQKKLSDTTRNYIRDNYNAANTNIWIDYDHSVPDWDALYKLGFPGIAKRAAEYREKYFNELTPKQAAYFESIEIEYSAIIRLLKRMYAYALTKTHPKAATVAQCLKNLSEGAPQTFYDCLQLIYLYFMLSESVDCYQVRALGSGIDNDLYCYYKNDIESGRYTKEEIGEFFGYFLMQFSAIGNYWGQPMYIGGSNKDGSCKVNELSYLILDVYDELGIYNPKIQVKYGKNTPLPFINKILDMIRRGNSSFVLVCEENIYKGFEQRGIPFDEYFDFDIKGCYEYAVKAKELATDPVYINLAQSVCTVLHGENSAEITSYEMFEAEYYKNLKVIFDGAVAATNEMERYLDYLNPSIMLSATFESSIRQAKDAFFEGAKYNTSSFVVSGLATAVDSLMAVKKLVFDDKKVTLSELKTVLDNNWEGAEKLRFDALKLTCKYGTGNAEADACGAKLAEFTAGYQGIKNSRGGEFKITIHSARQFIEFGKLMGATPDGRKAGEETSKNASPVPGADKMGVTALIMSAAKTKPYRFTEGHCLDVMIHPTAAEGDEGLAAMKALIDVYAENGGASIQFNVLNAKTLKDAQKHPEKYRNLQVRVCGWNVLFNNMCKKEQDEYIKRAEAI